MTTGYSGTPLAKKLGLKKDDHVLLYNIPEHYFKLFTDLPSLLNILNSIEEDTADLVHLFFTSHSEMKSNLSRFILAMKKKGVLWVRWPKRSSAIVTDLNRDLIREYVLGNGLVDIKVAAIDNDWSGLKFVYRKNDR